ncbi:MAG: hypothetical protein QXR54_00085 [Nanopusillaceae archaeon]
MIHIPSFILGLFIGFSLATLFIYFWIKTYISKILGDKEKMLKNLLDLLESKRK